MHEILAFVRVVVTQLPNTETVPMFTVWNVAIIPSDGYIQINLLETLSVHLKKP